MKKVCSVIALLLALIMALPGAALAEAGDEATEKVYAMGDTVDDFTIALSDGTEVSLSGLLETHKAVMINIWASWCNPCRMEFPYMEEAYAQVQDDLAIIAVSVEPTDTDDVINAFKEELGLSILPMAADTIGLTDCFACEGYPTSIMIDRYGVICWQETGSITSTDVFLRLFNAFIGDDYTQSLVDFEIPKVSPTVDAPSVSDAAAACLAEGSDIAVSFDTEDEYAWPWVVTEDGLASSNTGVDDSYANVNFTVTAADGDVFCCDLKVSCETYDLLKVSIDGELAKVMTGEKDWTNYAAVLSAGEHTVTLSFEKDISESGEEDTAWVKNVRVATGEEAAALTAAMPVYPHAIESGVEINADTSEAREIVFEYASEDSEEYLAGYMGKFFIAGSDEMTFSVSIGEEINPEFSVVYNNFDGTEIALADAEIDGDAYVVSGNVSAMDVDGYSYNNFYVYENYYDSDSAYEVITTFRDEQNVNAFVQEMYDEEGNPMILSWKYADGTLPSTDEIAAAGEDSDSLGYASYTLYFVDEDGNPVEGVIANICDDTSCQPMTSDENGVVEFVNVPFTYHIQVIKIPSGYTFDTSAEYYTDAAGGEMTFTLTKEAQ